MTAHEILPVDFSDAVLLGRVWDSERMRPCPVAVRGERLVDLGGLDSTISGLLERADVVAAVTAHLGAHSSARSWDLDDVLAADPDDTASVHLLAPVDLQVLKACGVTFVESMVERLIEERAGGDLREAARLREELTASIGAEVTGVVPGSPEALALKTELQARRMWSPYLEVGIGPDPEVFTKGPVLSAVGHGARVGIPAFSAWNNPEPELVLVCDSCGNAKGATLGNDVNLRDVEGRSALLLGMAKDNNASTAIGPFLRLFDERFALEALREEQIELRVEGEDGYLLEGLNSLSNISRPFERLIAAVYGEHHRYPDGFALFTGTLFAPTQDRGAAGRGFTHERGDVVSIRSDHLGTLRNVVGPAERIAPWEFGVRALIEALSRGD